MQTQAFIHQARDIGRDTDVCILANCKFSFAVFMRLRVALCFYCCASFCCKMYSWNTSTFLFSLLPFSLTLWVFSFSTKHFCFLCFHSLWRLGFFRFLVQPDREITKSLAPEENIFRKKTFVHPLRLWQNLIAGTKRAVPSGHYRSLLPSWVANQNVEFD